jgi:hypothetical protein
VVSERRSQRDGTPPTLDESVSHHDALSACLGTYGCALQGETSPPSQQRRDRHAPENLCSNPAHARCEFVRLSAQSAYPRPCTWWAVECVVVDRVERKGPGKVGHGGVAIVGEPAQEWQAPLPDLLPPPPHVRQAPLLTAVIDKPAWHQEPPAFASTKHRPQACLSEEPTRRDDQRSACAPPTCPTGCRSARRRRCSLLGGALGAGLPLPSHRPRAAQAPRPAPS